MMKLGIRSDFLNTDQVQINQSLRSRISLPELFSLLFLLGLVFVFSYHHHLGYYQPWDFQQSYLPAGGGDYSNYFYGYWIMPVFWLLKQLPFTLAFLIWSILNLLGAFFAARVFGGKTWLAIFSYQMMYVIFYGQITGLIVGGLALAWWGMANKKLHWAGLGFLICAIKPQLGLPLSMIIWTQYDLMWKERFKILLVPAAGLLMTFILYPDWIQNILLAVQSGKVDTMGNISIWRFIGPWSLVFFLFPMIIKVSRHDRIMLLIAAVVFATPYLQQTGLLILLVLPFGWLGILGNLGFLFPFFMWDLVGWLFLIPLSIYVLMCIELLIQKKSSPV